MPKWLGVKIIPFALFFSFVKIFQSLFFAKTFFLKYTNKAADTEKHPTVCSEVPVCCKRERRLEAQVVFRKDVLAGREKTRFVTH